MNLRNLRGVIPTLSTIFTAKGDVDVRGMRSLVRFSLDQGVNGLAVGMVAWEFYKLNDNERKRVMRLVIDETDGKVPVLAGTSYSGTEPAIELGAYAKDIGAEGIVVMPPYFMKKESAVFVFEHYSRIASAIDLPLMIQDAEEDIFVPIELSFYPKIAKEFSHVFMVKVESLEPLKRIGEIQDLMGGRMHTYGAKSIIDELELGAYGHVPSSGLTDLFVKLFNDYQNGVKDIKRSDTYIKYRRYLAFRARYPLLSAGIEKEILRRRGVIDSTYVRGPSPKMSATARRELGKLLNQIGYSDG